MIGHAIRALILLVVGSFVMAAEPVTEPRLDRHGDPLPPGAVARYGRAALLHDHPHRLVFSPGGKFLASSSYKDLRVWDLKTGRLLHSVPATTTAVPFVFAFTPDSLLVAQGNEVRLLDTVTGKVRRTLDRRPPGTIAHDFAVAADGRSVAVSWQYEGVVVYDLTASGEARPHPVCEDALDHLCLSADGRYLAGFGQTDVEVWDVSAARKVQTIPLEGERREEVALALNADGSRVAVASSNKVHVWLTATGKSPAKFQAPEEDYRQLQFSADGKTLIGLNWNGRVVHWSAETGQEERVFPERVGLESPRALADDGVTEAAADAHLSRIHVWNVGTGEEPLKGDPTPLAVNFVAPDLVASDTSEGPIILWRTKDGAVQRRLGRSHDVLSPDGKYLAAAADEEAKEVVISEVANGKIVSRLPAHGPPQDFAPNGKWLLTAAGNGEETYSLWDVSSGRLLRTFTLPDGWWGLTFSPDGRTLVTGEAEAAVFYEVASGKVRERLPLPPAPELNRNDATHREYQFTPDGRTLLVRREKDVVVISRRPGGPVFQLPTGDNLGSALSPDGRWLATGHDLTVEVRDLHNPGAAVVCHPFVGHEGYIWALNFSPDGRFLVSASLDGTALVWDMQPLVEEAARKPPEPDDHRLAAWWAALADEPEKAGAAMLALESHPDQAVSLLAAHLAPARAPAPERVARWVAALDGDDFARRDEAARELEQLGPLAEPVLRAALTKNPGAELKRRLEKLLERLDTEEMGPEQLRDLRAVELLERMGTSEARKVLQGLAQGAPAAMLTKEVKASLERWPSP